MSAINNVSNGGNGVDFPETEGLSSDVLDKMAQASQDILKTKSTESHSDKDQFQFKTIRFFLNHFGENLKNVIEGDKQSPQTALGVWNVLDNFHEEFSDCVGKETLQTVLNALETKYPKEDTELAALLDEAA